MEKRSSTSEIYQGSYSSLKPGSETGSYASIGRSDNYINAGSFGMSTDPRVGNIIQEVSTKLSSGIKTIEVSAIQPDIFDSIPKQHLKEVNRLAKLTGIDVTLHGPLIETSGIGQQGFSEADRLAAERKITNALLRSHELNPTGNIPVTFHSTNGVPGSQFLPPSQRTADEIHKKLFVVNKEEGRVMNVLEAEPRHAPGRILEEGGIILSPEESLRKGEILTPEDRLRTMNYSLWSRDIDQVFFNQERAQEILGKNQVQIQHVLSDIDKMKKEGYSYEQIRKTLNPTQAQALGNFQAAKSYLDDVEKQAMNSFNKAYRFGDTEQKKLLEKLNAEYTKMVEKVQTPLEEAEATRYLINQLKTPVLAPKLFVPVEEFTIEKSAKTFGNAAFEGYKKFKDTAPLMVIENPPAGGGLSTANELKNLIEASRNQFVEQAKKEGISEHEARKQAEKLIGATWDVGHINMVRGQGYSEKEVIKESEIIAPFVKHVHLSDNFGLEHTELPMGMGNVPIKQIMEKLGQAGYDAKKIIEAGNWWQHFKTQPFQETLEAFGSPIYSMKMAPYWDQSRGLYQGYFSGLQGQWLPQINYETFGTTFARLPNELGGSMQGGQGNRMSGRPME